jgi:pyruvate ferredoxin oxidoreductase gamma subunit
MELPMLLEFVFIGRGGQGLYTATELLVKAVIMDGYYAQGIPFFGAERRGAVTYSYLRISDNKIARHDKVLYADGIIIGDGSPEALRLASLYRLKENGKVLVNIDRLNMRELSSKTSETNVYAVGADSLAREEGLVISGWPVIGPVMAGSFSRVFGLPRIDSLVEAARSIVGEQSPLLLKNIRLITRGYNEVRMIKYEYQRV